MTKDEALRLALEALEANDLPLDEKTVSEWELKTDAAITAIKAALEAKDEPWEKFCDSHCVWTDHHPDCKLAKDEPVGYFSVNDYGNWEENESNNGIPLYTNPPQRKPLTDEEIDVIDEANWEEDHKVWGIHNFARAIEAAHGIK